MFSTSVLSAILKKTLLFQLMVKVVTINLLEALQCESGVYFLISFHFLRQFGCEKIDFVKAIIDLGENKAFAVAESTKCNNNKRKTQYSVFPHNFSTTSIPPSGQ